MIDLNIGKWLKPLLAGVKLVVEQIGTRIGPAPVRLAETFPAIRYRTLATEFPAHITGLTGHVKPRVRVTVWDTDNDRSLSVCSAIVEQFKDSVPVQDKSGDGFKLGFVTPVDAGQEFVDLADGSQMELYGNYVDLSISYAK